MVAFKAKKVIANLPSTLEPDTVYYVRTGVGFDTYLTDSTGNVAHKLNANTDSGGSSFLPVPELSDHDVTYFYFGWEDVNGTWLIQRQNRETSVSQSASTGYVDLTGAWANKENLEYS